MNQVTPAKPAITLDELLGLDDEAFVTRAYAAILGREPDSGGLRNYVSQVRAGVEKAHILAELIESPEGMQKNAPIPDVRKMVAGYRKPRPTIWNHLFRRLAKSSMEPTERQLRVINNRLYLMEQALLEQTRQLVSVRALMQRMNHQTGAESTSLSSSGDAVATTPPVSHLAPSLARIFAELKTLIAKKQLN